MNQQQSPETPVGRFINRIEYLIKSDEDLTVNEVLGALQAISFNVLSCAFEKVD
jgi:hypothetical protein